VVDDFVRKRIAKKAQQAPIEIIISEDWEVTVNPPPEKSDYCGSSLPWGGNELVAWLREKYAEEMKSHDECWGIKEINDEKETIKKTQICKKEEA
jgi:hypothetical protein